MLKSSQMKEEEQGFLVSTEEILPKLPLILDKTVKTIETMADHIQQLWEVNKQMADKLLEMSKEINRLILENQTFHLPSTN